MNWFNKLFKEDEEKPVAAIGGDEPAAPVEVVGAHATTKVKLNFKRLPKKMVEAMADQTTGETIIREDDETPPRKRGGIMEEFNEAARDITGRGDDNGRNQAWNRDRKLAGLMTREERERMVAMPRPAAPRAPSPSF